MNKKLLAIAVGAAMVAGTTAATAGDEPTWYGKIHLSIDSMDSDATAPAAGDREDGIFVSSNSSRLGIKGKVALDGGMNAVYKYEMSTRYASNADVDGDRNAYLGLNSGDHTVIVGRHDMPFKTVGRKNDLFGDTIGDTRAIMRLRSGGDDWADRRDNVIMYTGQFDMIGVKVAYAPEEGADDSTDTGIGITYKGGPLKVMFANETHGNGNLGGTEDSTGNILAGSYKMGNMKFHAGFMQVANVGGVDGNDVDGWTLAASMKSGMNTFKIQYTSGEGDATDTDSTLVALGVDHALSKKTKVYAAYAAISNGDAATSNFADTGHDSTVTSSATGGDSPSGFSVGMVHKF